MKNSIVIIALLLFSLGANAKSGDKNISYVKTRNNVYFGRDLKIGLFNFKIISDDGTITKISNRDVSGYLHDSRLFEYLPVVGESNQILCYSMMEYVTCRSGLRLYRYTCYDNNDFNCNYFVFKDGKYYLRIDRRNALSVLPFFGIKHIEFSEKF